MTRQEVANWLAAKLACDPDTGPSEPKVHSYSFIGYGMTHYSVIFELNGETFELKVEQGTF